MSAALAKDALLSQSASTAASQGASLIKDASTTAAQGTLSAQDASFAQGTPSAAAQGGEGPSSEEIAAFQREVREQGKLHWRDLPWRNIDDDYAVLVSEVMLQQTQVQRVLGYWQRFMALFPTLDALAAADTRIVLENWQGLGYNRRALMLKRCAEECAARYQGKLPRDRAELLGLPGIGPATAGGILAFARNEPCIYLETNVRCVFLRHFFSDEDKVPDRLIEPLVAQACPEGDVRGWYYALLDYGAHLKATGENHSRRARAYTRQSVFEGSRRQKRAAILRFVLGGEGVSLPEIVAALEEFEAAAQRPAPDPALVQEIVDELVAEGFFRCEDGLFRA